MRWFDRMRYGLLFLAVVGVSSCSQDDDKPGPDPVRGDADFTKYVAVGNSLTAGFADGGVYREGQLNSYPLLLSQQFKLVGGGDFVQPLFTAEQAAGSGYVKLTKLPTSASSTPTLTLVLPAAVRGVSNGRFLYTKFTGTNQNLGVPGIKMADIQTPGYGSVQGNPYFERLLPETTPLKTYLDYVSDNLAGATFFSCWMGNNDVLGYASSGGAEALTPTNIFTANYTALLNKLTENNRKGVVLGIPNVLAAPFFTTVTQQALLAQVNASLPSGVSPFTSIFIQTAGGTRAARAGDLFLLTQANSATGGEYLKIGRTDAGTKLGPYGLVPTNPFPTQFVLDADEATAAVSKLNEFNALMKQQAEAKGLVYVDPNQLLGQLGQTGGLTQDGVAYNLGYVSGGVISLDGIHLTPAGYALVANEVIKGINNKYKSTLPLLNTSLYRRVLLQQ